MWSKIRNKLFRAEKEKASEPVVCKNCATEFVGHYCPHCGQSVSDYDRPFSFLFFNFLGDFFAFDERFFKTTVDLMFKPGFLTKEYFEGKRIRYAPPFRVFIFTSFVLFLLLQIYTNRGLQNVLHFDLHNQETFDTTAVAAIDSMLTLELGEQTEGDSTGSVDAILTMDSFRKGDVQSWLETAAAQKEKELKEETDPERRKEIQDILRVLRSPEQVNARILKYMSWAFFLLLPIFALILKLFYIRRRQNYIRHLIFSIHIHSYLFVLLIIITGMYLTLPYKLGLVTLILLLSFPVYTILAMKNFYRQGIGKAIVKFLGISFIYNTIFLSFVIYVIIEALQV
ncbi:DUF3667 domain-containing protein [Maribellus sp. CM-23]|uniref:DUF3667 domain-containing protein n=1 Tax=Maribellus sp. CM-23 TaxID=2781026 RepID=UPI001F17494A|nr:DUF3667 domain-containing protein [Maribellus sp. CM-23]MCE4564520.1 DUF3667 domain-containing protein [Maribellus sp. CM-23]